MNPTENKITFFSHEDFLSFIGTYGSERYGKDKNNFSFDWFCLPNDEMLEHGFGEGKLSLINGDENSISFMTKWRPAIILFNRMCDLGINFRFYSRGKNNEGFEGFVKDKRYYMSKIFDEAEEYAEEVVIDGKKQFVWQEKRKRLTVEKAKLHTTLKKGTGEYGSISKFEDGCIEVCTAEILPDETLPSEEVITSYKNIGELIDDGWAIDMFDSSLVHDLNPEEKEKIAAIFL